MKRAKAAPREAEGLRHEPPAAGLPGMADESSRGSLTENLDYTLVLHPRVPGARDRGKPACKPSAGCPWRRVLNPVGLYVSLLG